MALKRRTDLDPALVAARAADFPIIRDLLGDRVEAILNGKRQRADSSPLLLRLLEQTGANSHAMLELFSEGVTHFDSLALPGWQDWRGTLAGAEARSLSSRYSELLVAMWFSASGYEVREFEPTGAPGRRADLLVALDGEQALIEVTSPGPHSNDWVDAAMEHLTFALTRVESGLVISVEGYEALSFDPGGTWGSTNPRVGTQQQEELVHEFARAVEKISIDQLPQVVVSPAPGQPISITATEHHEELAHRATCACFVALRGFAR